MYRRHIGRLLVASFVVVTALSLVAWAKQDKPAAGGMPSPEEMQSMMEEMGKVGPQHKQLEQHFAGNWDCDVTAYWGPSPDKSKGTCRSEMMLGGRYLHDMFEGSFMGQPFQGAGVSGYDNMKKKYFNTWMDSMSTGLMVSEGDYDESTKTYTFVGESIGPDGKPCTMRQVVKIDSDDKHTFTMYGPGMDGKEMKMMEIVYTRK